MSSEDKKSYNDMLKRNDNEIKPQQPISMGFSPMGMTPFGFGPMPPNSFPMQNTMPGSMPMPIPGSIPPQIGMVPNGPVQGQFRQGHHGNQGHQGQGQFRGGHRPHFQPRNN